MTSLYSRIGGMGRRDFLRAGFGSLAFGATGMLWRSPTLRYSARRGDSNSTATGNNEHAMTARPAANSDASDPVAMIVLVSAGRGRNLKVSSVIKPSVP